MGGAARLNEQHRGGHVASDCIMGGCVDEQGSVSDGDAVKQKRANVGPFPAGVRRIFDVGIVKEFTLAVHKYVFFLSRLTADHNLKQTIQL